MKMRQSVLISPGAFELRQVDKPSPQNHEVLIRVKAVGICGSDIHTYHGAHPFVHTPIVLGHEATGEVVELGADVDSLSIGDRVIMRPQRTCGKCRPCEEGRYNICKHLDVLGCLSTGASSDFFAADSDIFYKLPENLSYTSGILLEPLAVGIHALNRGGGAQGKNILVTGAGTIGLVTAQAAKAMGAASVMITDVSDFKLDMAKNCGIDHNVNVATTDLKSAVNSVFGEDILDMIVECSAVESAINQAIDIATKGTNIVVAGVFEGMPKTDLASVQDREYSLIGSLMYTHDDYVEAINMAGKGLVYLDKLITNIFTLEQNKEAFEYIDKNRDTVQKVIIEV